MGSRARPDTSSTDLVNSFQTLLQATPDVANFLAEVSKLAAASVMPPAAVGVTTRYDGHPVTIATSDERAALVDEEQYSKDEGPCLQAMRTGEFVEVKDQIVDDRWPGYRDHAVKLGVRCSLSYPLIVEGKSIGAMNTYGFHQVDGFTDQDRQRATAFATQAATALNLSVRFVKQVEISNQLEQALTSRSVIDQAIGVLMGQQRCDADTAFTLLRINSQNTNRKLRDVAAEIVTRLSGHAPGEARRFIHGDAGSLSETS